MNRRLLLAAALVAAAACDNGGASRTIGIGATGIVRGEVFFDANGSGAQDAGDVDFAGVTVRILSTVGADTLLSAPTLADGSFRFAAVPVGTWVLEVDSASVGDTAVVAGTRRTPIAVLPGDSIQFSGAVTYPVRTVAQSRTGALGARIFVRAIALNARTTFSDTTLHVVDLTGSIRSLRVRPTTANFAAGDSVVLRGTTATRLGQRVLDDVAVFLVGPTLVPTTPLLTTAVAAAGGTAGALDAALIRGSDVLVTDTATVAGNMTLTVSDGSGPLVIELDRAADIAFRAPLPVGLFVPGNRFDVSGVLVPNGNGTWRLKPRSALDLVRR